MSSSSPLCLDVAPFVHVSWGRAERRAGGECVVYIPRDMSWELYVYVRFDDGRRRLCETSALKESERKEKKGNEEGEKQGRRIVVAWDNENTSSWKRSQVSRAQYRVLDRLSDISPRLQDTEL